MFLSQQKNSKASNVSLTHEIVCRVLSVNFGGNSGLKIVNNAVFDERMVTRKFISGQPTTLKGIEDPLESLEC